MLGLVYSHRQHVRCAGLQMRREIVKESRVSVGMCAEVAAVDIHGRVHVDAFELDADLAARPGGGNGERAPVPAHAAGKEAAASARGVLRIHPALDAPIVRHVEGAPGGGVEAGAFGARGVPQEKSPLVIEGQTLARRRLLTGGLGGSQSARGREYCAKCSSVHRRHTPSKLDFWFNRHSAPLPAAKQSTYRFHQ